jgi:CDP-diacylglycerol--serine O-phosphatidyltransferase
MPIPAAAGQVAAIVFFFSSPLEHRLSAILLSAIVVVLAFLMVSTFRYPSFKGVDLRSRRSYINVLGIALLFLLVAIHPKWVMLCGSTLYTLSAPAMRMVSFLRRRSGPPPPVVAADPAV